MHSASRRLNALAAITGLPLVAAGDVLMHVRSRKPLQDALTATRLGKPVAECGFALEPNAEAHLRSRQRLAALYPADWLEATVRIAGAARSRSTSCATSTPRRSCPTATRPPAGCARSPRPARASVSRGGVPPKVRDRPSSTSSR